MTWLASLLVLLLVPSAWTGAARACSPSDFDEQDFADGAVSSRELAPGLSPAGAAAQAGAWQPAAPMLLARQEVAVAELDGRIYVLGGIDGTPSFLASVEIYDPATDSWSSGPALPVPLHHTTASVVDGKLYAIGGWSDFFATPLDVVFELDPQQGSWVTRSSMPTARGSPAAAVLDGKIYVAGGWPSARARDFAVYDPATDEWQTLADLPSGRNHLGLAAAGGTIFAVGGRTALQAGVGNVADVDAYDPGTDTWSAVAPLARARSGLASVGSASRVFALGGEGSAANPDGTFEDVEAFDLATGSWTPLPDMALPRHGIGAAIVGGRLHVPGGGPIQNFSVTATHDFLDLSALLFPKLPALSLPAVLALAASLGLAARRLRHVASASRDTQRSRH